jgi:hypothetical protein
MGKKNKNQNRAKSQNKEDNLVTKEEEIQENEQ